MVARIFLLLALVALAGCVSDRQVQAPAGDYLSHEELSALLSQTRSVRITTGRVKATGIYSKDGTAFVDWGAGTAKGTWQIVANRFCTKYPGMRQGFETCFLFRQTGTNTYSQFAMDGSFWATWFVEK